MSHQLGRVVSEILHQYFGEIVQKVGHDLFIYGSKPIPIIVKTTGLPRKQVVDSLRTLVKFDLVSFEPSFNEVVADYKLNPDNVLLLIRYPRYLLQIKTKFGSEAEILVEELLQQASCTASVLMVTVAAKYKDDKEKNVTLVKLRDIFISIATARYIQQAPVADNSDVPSLEPVATIVPDIDVRQLAQAIATDTLADVNDNIYWKVNFDRFHQDFRDDIMVKAITRRIDENAGELMRLLLQQMYLSSGEWAAESNPTPALELRAAVERADFTDCAGSDCDRKLLQLHIDQYLRVLEESGAGFVRRSGESGGGLYAVRGRHAAHQLLLDALDHCVTERLGSNAARIFRLIRTKKYIEEDDIQKHAMLPNKECKELTYKLLEEHFISIQPMRKAASSGAMAKAVYLYHIKLHHVAQSLRELCHRALHNTLRRAAHTRAAHARLLDKQRRVRSIVHSMRVRGEPQQHIDDVEETLTPPELSLLKDVEARLKQLSGAQLALDKNLFILNWYFMYPQ